LKTAIPERVSGVRIPLPPPAKILRYQSTARSSVAAPAQLADRPSVPVGVR